MSAFVYDPKDRTQDFFRFDDLFARGVIVGGEVKVNTNFFCMPGEHHVGAMWKHLDQTDLAFAEPPPGQYPQPVVPGFATKSDAYTVYYGFDQYLVQYSDTPRSGFGLFGRASISDGNPTPLRYFLSAGIGGDSPFRQGCGDKFGIGWYYVGASNEFGPIPQAVFGPRDGTGVELFYNFQVTPWLNITPDIQYIRPEAGAIADDAFVYGIRVNAKLQVAPAGKLTINHQPIRRIGTNPMLRKTLALRIIALSWCTTCLLMAGQRVQGQLFGIETHNTLMPASGGMAGASIARPQDVTSAMNANAATLTQFEGTQFVFGGFWAEPTFNMTQTAPLPLLGVDPYSAKSTAQGVAGANIGVTQSLEAMGMPATIGLGFISNAAGGVDFRHVPQSNRTNSAVTVLELAASAGVQLTERLSVGATAFFGTGIFDGPFVGLGGLTTDYALRASLGLNYDLTDYTTIGAYYRTEQQFTFANAIQFGLGPTLNVNMDLPRNVGIGIANNSLMDGRLLLAMAGCYREGTSWFRRVSNAMLELRSSPVPMVPGQSSAAASIGSFSPARATSASRSMLPGWRVHLPNKIGPVLWPARRGSWSELK